MKKRSIQKPIIKPKKGEHKIWIGIGVGAFAILGIVGYRYYKKRKEKKTLLGFIAPSNDAVSRAVPTATTSFRPKRFRCTNKDYPLRYGTCNKDVQILQSYLLKTYKAALGSSGRNKDGVDGMFGNKTNKAAKIYLGKVSFSKNDIEGMKTAIKTIKR